MFPKAYCKFGIPITHDKLWHPMMPDHISKNNFVESKVVTIILIGVGFANLENQSTIMRMTSIPFG
jgi:hypothetical protein